MKFTKKCDSTQHKIRISNRRRSSAGMFYTSSAGAVISLILHKKECTKLSIVPISITISLCFISTMLLSLTGATNLLGLGGSAYADYTLSMTSSGAQSIDVLPGSSGGSSIGTSIGEDAITVSTTCRSGYNLSMSTSVNDNKLYLDGNSSSSSYFSPVDGTSPLANSTNKWGYYFNNSSTAPTPSNVFSAIPALGSTAVIKSPLPTPSSTDIEDSFSIYYGVGVNSNLTPGTYKMKPDTNNSSADGTITYYLTLADACIATKTYMQDVTEADLATLMPNDGDSATLYDKRDDSDYQITNINGSYWMTQNLRITHTTGQSVGTILAENSNFNSDITFNGDLTSGNTYTAKRYHVPNETDLSTLGLTSDEVGVWYNYCAVSAGTVCNSSDTVDATQDICPAGWRLPTTEEQSMLIPYRDDLPLYFTGYFSGGSLTSANSRGYWWGSSANNATTQYSLRYMTSGGSTTFTSTTSNKRYGFSARCIKKTDTPSKQTLYDLVATQSKGTQTLAELRAAITTSNSGVYEYNSSVFGAASDAANTSKIYYYRGILDNTTGSYGSDGDNAAWPNTVLLDTTGNGKDTTDTCWRIVRTTGSGGVKMIYQGKWTGSTCANATTSAQVATSYFNATSNIGKKSIIAVGYTFNSNYKTTTDDTAYSTLFGSNTSYSGNSTASTMKTYIENTWFTNINSFASKLEQSAGWCNDRTIRSSSSSTSVISDSTSISTPYTTASSGITAYYFGSYVRTRTSSDKPSLGCPRSGADLYTTSSASNGNKQLGKPAALLTADEAAFAGSGYSSSTTPYHANSYLRSGSNFWLLSHYYRGSDGIAYGFRLLSAGSLNGYSVSGADGVRPAISLKAGSEAVSGSGTAADPWIVDASVSPNPYCTDASTCMQNTTNPPTCGTTMTDGRDGNTYTTATIGGACWMTQNLRFTGAELKVGESDVTSDVTMTYGQLTSGNSFTEPRIAIGSTTDYGTYYNYCAASAGEVCNDTTKQDATRSICPAGWKLPTQAQLNAVPELDSHFTASSGLAGHYYGGSLDLAGTDGNWWASTANSVKEQYYLYYDSDVDFWYDDIDNKYSGYSVRCVRAS